MVKRERGGRGEGGGRESKRERARGREGRREIYSVHMDQKNSE